MSNDRELLELAAKAAGYEVHWVDQFDVGLTNTYMVPLPPNAQHFAFSEHPYKKWEPLRDDGDALRLAVKLHMTIDLHWLDRDEVSVYARKSSPCERGNCDHFAATRRAIVRAAAEIGRALG